MVALPKPPETICVSWDGLEGALKTIVFLLCSLATTTVLLKDKGVVSEVHSSRTKTPFFCLLESPQIPTLTWSSSEAGRGSWHHGGERGQKQLRHGLSCFLGAEAAADASPLLCALSSLLSHTLLPLLLLCQFPAFLPLWPAGFNSKGCWKRHCGAGTASPLCSAGLGLSKPWITVPAVLDTTQGFVFDSVSHHGLTLRNSAMQKCCNGILQGSFYTHG